MDKDHIHGHGEHKICSKEQNGICICNSKKLEASIRFKDIVSEELYREIIREINLKFKSFTIASTKINKKIYIIMAQTHKTELTIEDRKELVQILMQYNYEKLYIGKICNELN